MTAPRTIGALIQALLLGTLLAFAIGSLVAQSSDARVFTYQNY